MPTRWILTLGGGLVLLVLFVFVDWNASSGDREPDEDIKTSKDFKPEEAMLDERHSKIANGESVGFRREKTKSSQTEVVKEYPKYELIHGMLMSSYRMGVESAKKNHLAHMDKMVESGDVSLKDSKREAWLAFTVLKEEALLSKIEKGEFWVLDDGEPIPPIPKGYHRRQTKHFIKLDGRWKNLFIAWDPKKFPAAKAELERHAVLAELQVDQWIDDFNKKPLSERKTYIEKQASIKVALKECTPAGMMKNRGLRAKCRKLKLQLLPLPVSFSKSDFRAYR